MKTLMISVLAGMTLLGCGDEDVAPIPPPALVADICYTMDTSMGALTLAIDTTNMPITANNFQQYADDGFYDGTIFHRISRQFVAQGGGFTPGLISKKTRGPIENEAGVGISNQRGTLAMARTDAPHSATSQFFINTVDNVNLDQSNAMGGYGYAVFGQVIEGMDIVDLMDIVDTHTVKGFKLVPVEDIVITSVSEVTCPTQ